MNYKFIFLRHGRSLADDEGKHEGQYDSPLTEIGIRQAKNIAEILKSYDFDLIISSPLKRALQTAEVISKTLNIKIEVNDLFKERDNGILAGLTFEEAEIKYPESKNQSIYRNFPCESGENEIQLNSRALLCINAILKKKPGKYLIIAHGKILNAIIKQILKMPIGNLNNSAVFRLKDTGYIEMDYYIEKDLWVFNKMENRIKIFMDSTMFFQMVVEQRKNDEFRNKYDDKLKSFIKTKYKSLLYERKYNGVYGWIVGYGEPPKKHLDVLLLTNKEYSLGDIIEIKIIGVFLRNDHDNKFIALEKERDENDFSELKEKDKNMLLRLYPNIRDGEGWFGKEKALRLLIV